MQFYMFGEYAYIVITAYYHTNLMHGRSFHISNYLALFHGKHNISAIQFINLRIKGNISLTTVNIIVLPYWKYIAL